MNKDQKVEGLRERIAAAATPEDVSKLLDEASTYSQASDKTRRAWKNTAAKRLDALTGGGDEVRKAAGKVTLEEFTTDLRTAIKEEKAA